MAAATPVLVVVRANVADPYDDVATTVKLPAGSSAAYSRGPAGARTNGATPGGGGAAVPEASEPTVAAGVPVVENVPLGPLDGAVNVTAIPAWPVVTGHPFALVNRTSRLVANAAPVFVVWGVPADVVMVLGGLAEGHVS